MKKFTATALLLLPAVAIFAQSGTFSIKGTLPNAGATSKAFLLYTSDGKPVSDSTQIVNGAFEFKGTVANPTMGTLLVTHSNQNLGELRRSRKVDMLSMYIENVNMQVTGTDSLKHRTVISGSPLNADNATLKAALNPVDEKMTALYIEERAAKDATPAQTEAFDNRENALDGEKKVIVTKFIKEHPASFVSLNNLSTAAGYYPEASDLEPLYNMLSPELKATKQGKAYAERIPKLKLVAMGATAPEFSQADKDGKMIALSSFRGKFVLIDFWASWCGPCRAENPNVVKAYNQFKDKNFTILGVSLDQPNGREKWLAAIEKDGLVWTQVTDLKFWQNEASTLYGVQAIPQNFLLDPNGKIIGKNLRGAALVNKLAQVTGGSTKTTGDKGTEK
ncbi:redoxin domain-containing protein [Mucilaginibacter sp. AW1-3]